MSSVAISYSSLKDASGEARDVSKKLTAYANSLNSSVYRKLSNYSGSHTQNIQNAYNSVGNKIENLRSRAEAYSTYASDLDDLRSDCDDVDKAVKGLVSKLTGTFKDAHGITNSKVQNAVNYFLTSIDNSSVAGRWLGNENDQWNQSSDYIKQCIEDWWDYEGGKQLVVGVAVAVLEIVAGAAAVIAAMGAVVAALVAGGLTFALVTAAAALVVGVIATVNGVANLVNECRAYNETQNGDPAAGRRLSGEDTVQDIMRNESEENVSFWYNVAKGIDIVNVVCGIVSIISSCGKFVKNAYKWTTGSTAPIKNLQIRNILTFDNIKAFGDKIKLSFKLGTLEIKSAIKYHDFTNIKAIALSSGSDFINSLKKAYTNFDSIKDTAATIRNIVSIPHDLLKDGFTAKNVLVNIGLKTIILPNISTLSTDKLVTYDSSKTFVFDMYTFDSFNPVYDTYKIISGIKTNFEKFFKDNTVIGRDLIYKLSQSCEINISIPQIYIPDINIPVVNIQTMAA